MARQNTEKGGKVAEDSEKPMERFRRLTKRLLNIPASEVREQERQYQEHRVKKRRGGAA